MVTTEVTYEDKITGKDADEVWSLAGHTIATRRRNGWELKSINAFETVTFDTQLRTQVPIFMAYVRFKKDVEV